MILPTGDFKICCFTGHKHEGNETHGVATDDNGKVMNVLTHDIMEAMNSKWHKELRLAQSRGERHEICKVCWDRDDAAETQGEISTSLRVVRSYYQNDWGKENMPDRLGGYPMSGGMTPENADKWMDAEGKIKTMPLSLDMRFSNLCNSKCIMCEPLYSSLWYEDWELVHGKKHFDVGPKRYNIIKKTGGSRATYTTDMPDWNDDPRWWAQFDKMAPRLRHIYITGGEPFVQPVHDVFIQKLVERGYAKDIVIEYDTNLTVLNRKILNMLKQFKDIIIRVSLDGVEEKYNLIRYPAKFDRVMENIRLLEEYDLQDKIVNITCCIGIYSIFSPIDHDKFFKPLGYTRFQNRLLRSPPQVDIINLPRSIKERVIEIYEESGIDGMDSKHVVGYLKNTLDAYTDEECKPKMKAFISYMNSLDRVRGTNWVETFPEVYKLIDEFYNK
jgi:pyruvate-formate lyase-activating enzyme